MIITDSNVSPSIVKRLEELGIELIIAETKDLPSVGTVR